MSPSKILLKEVLEFGLENIRFSDKGCWFKSILPIFGPVKMMKYVSKKYMNKPESIIPCLFHLAFLINKKDQKEIDAYRNLVKISMNVKPVSDYYDYFKEFVLLLEKKWPELLPK